jgi:hypothetical protein
MVTYPIIDQMLFALSAVWGKTLRIEQGDYPFLLELGSLDQSEGTRGGESGDKKLRFMDER